MNFKLTVLLVASTTCVRSAAQFRTTPVVTSNCGGAGEDSGYKMEWTMGEFAIASIGNSQFHFTQGFHQGALPRQMEGVGIDEVNASEVITLFPNPAQDELFIRFAQVTPSPATMDIVGVDGKLLRSVILGSGRRDFAISIDDLAAGSYLAVIRTSPDRLPMAHRFLKTN